MGFPCCHADLLDRKIQNSDSAHDSRDTSQTRPDYITSQAHSMSPACASSKQALAAEAAGTKKRWFHMAARTPG